MNLREYLKTTNLITDGAFGTYFAAKYQTQDIPELANITATEKVKKIHEEYLNAGAKFIRTNTFASNKETLQEDFAEVEKNIQAAVEIARDAAAKDSIKGSLNVLDKSLSVLDSTSSMRKAGRTMKDTMDNEWNDMEDDNNFLNMDPNAEKVSFTSDENAEPNTLQIIMRTEEISVDDDAELLDAETAKADVNPLERMWNMLVQMVRAIIEIFKNR